MSSCNVNSEGVKYKLASVTLHLTFFDAGTRLEARVSSAS